MTAVSDQMIQPGNEPRTRGGAWHREDSLWAVPRDPEAVFIVAVLGAVLLWMTLMARLQWFDALPGHPGKAGFADVHRFLDAHASTRTLLAQLYFSGGAPALALVALLGIASTWIPVRANQAGRYLAIVSALAGVATTFLAPVLTSTEPMDVWLGRAVQSYAVTIAGFALLALAATFARPHYGRR